MGKRRKELSAAMGKVLLDHADVDAHEVIATLLALVKMISTTCPDPQQRKSSTTSFA